MHKVAQQIEAAIEIPLLHIADATAERIIESGMSRIGLLGTRHTMEDDFYRKRLEREHGLDVVIPSPAERAVLHRVIYKELCLGTILESSRAFFSESVGNLVDRGAEGVILGCTEIGLLLRETDVSVPLFDTARLHAEQAAKHALAD